jgi:RNA polymerase sigma-70 factor (ECF subfamily)
VTRYIYGQVKNVKKIFLNKSDLDLDQCLILIAKGDVNAFKMLYEEIQRPVYFFALSILKDEEDAKDVMQDTFIRVMSCAYQYRPKTNARAWIFRIVRNLAVDVIRSRSKTTDMEEKEDLADGNCFEGKVLDKCMTYELLSILKEDEREIVNLHIYGELTHLEIAKTLQIPYEVVRWKYSYALRKLKKHLSSMSKDYDIRKDVLYEK